MGPLPPAMAQTSDAAVNVYAYRPDGTPVGPVLLYDEAGRPVVVGGVGDDPGARSVETYSEALGQEVEVLPPTDANGNPVPNLYPRQLFTSEYASNGERIRRPVRPPQVDVPPSATAPSSSTAPTATTATAPSATASTAATATTVVPAPAAGSETTATTIDPAGTGTTTP